MEIISHSMVEDFTILWRIAYSMITVNDHQTGRLFDPWEYLGPKRRKLLDSSWSGVFRKYLLEKLPVGKVGRHFNEVMGRPTKELYTAIGALILQQFHDLSDPDVSMTLARVS